MQHKNTSIQFLGLVLLVCSIATQAKSQDNEATALPTATKWIKIDDFESPDTWEHWTLADTKNDTDPKVEHPQVTEVRSEEDGQNSYLIKKPAAEGIVGNRKALSYLKLPVAVEVGETYTFYTRINVEYFPNNHVFGLSNLAPEEINLQDYNALEPSLRVTDKHESDGTQNDGTLMVRKNGGYARIFNEEASRTAKPMQTNTWYEVWYVVNNERASKGGQSYDVYIRGGDEFPHQQCVYIGADFRMQRELPLTYFLTNCNTGPADAPYGNGGLRYDDLYMAAGVVLTVPSK